MDYSTAVTLTNLGMLAFVAICIWAICRRPAKPTDPAGVAELRAEVLRTARAVTLWRFASRYHRFDGGTGLCGCGVPIPCAERSRLDRAADQIIKERP